MEEEGWAGYFAWTAGREPRPLLIEALAQMRDREPTFAIDLGCGAGVETVALLQRGWSVLAVDADPEALRRLRAAVRPDDLPRLRMEGRTFTDVDLPSAQLIHAGFSLPFCPPSDFSDVWDRLVTAVDDDGLFVGQLFGDRDGWANRDDMTFHNRVEVAFLLREFDVLALREQERDGESFSGPKHWHVFDIIARKSAGRAAAGTRPAPG